MAQKPSNELRVPQTITATFAALTDSTTGAVSDICNDTTASVKDDLASIIAKVNAIRAVLVTHGLLA